MIATYAEVMEDWTRIYDRDCPIVMEARDVPLSEIDIAPLLAKAPFALRAEGEVTELLAQLAELPDAFVADIAALANRFAKLTGNSSLRVRLEGVTTNACKKVHADYTDVRLITTYAGPGTDFAPHGTEDHGGNCCLERVPTGAVALFKGRRFGSLVSESGHEPCLHRSPPIEGSGEARLVLVIDTPMRATEQ
jgi:Protein of unknown function (DUF1826)